MGLGGDNGPFVELRDSLKETGDVGGSEVCFRVDRVSYTHMHTHTQGRERETEGRSVWERVGDEIEIQKITIRIFLGLGWPVP